MAEQRNSSNGDGFARMYDQQQHPFDFETELETSRNQIKQHSYDSSSSTCKLFVGGVSWETTEETFSHYFCKYGEIADSVIMTDKHTGRPRGFGFVTFCDPAVADMVMRMDHVIDGRAVEVKRTVPKADMNAKFLSRTKKIFVGGIPSALSEDEFKDYFSTFGTIIDHQIVIDYQTGRSRGFGFITFENEDAVESIFAGDIRHELGGKQVEIKKAVPRRVSFDFNSYNPQTSFDFNSYNPQTSSGYDMYRYGGLNDGNVGRTFGGYDVFAPYGGGGYGGNYPHFYNVYSYGLGYGGSMYMNSNYGMNGYGVPGGYDCTTVGYGLNGYGRGGQGNGGSMAAERYHPY